jgi:hypothetical protein
MTSRDAGMETMNRLDALADRFEEERPHLRAIA